MYKYQEQFRINVLAEIVCDYLAGPHIICRIGKFLFHDLPKQLEDVPLVVRARIWYMCDGAPCCAICSQQHLS
jgi:hypothetical protein